MLVVLLITNACSHLWFRDKLNKLSGTRSSKTRHCSFGFDLPLQYSHSLHLWSTDFFSPLVSSSLMVWGHLPMKWQWLLILSNTHVVYPDGSHCVFISVITQTPFPFCPVLLLRDHVSISLDHPLHISVFLPSFSPACLSCLSYRASHGLGRIFSKSPLPPTFSTRFPLFYFSLSWYEFRWAPPS